MERKKIFSSTEDSLKFDRVEKTTISFPLELSNTLSITLLAYFSSGASIGYKFYSIQRSRREIVTGGRDREDDTDSYIFDIFDKFGRGPAWYYFSGLVAIVNLDGGAEYIRRPPTLSTFPFTFIYRVYLYIYIYTRTFRGPTRFQPPPRFSLARSFATHFAATWCDAVEKWEEGERKGGEKEIIARIGLRGSIRSNFDPKLFLPARITFLSISLSLSGIISERGVRVRETPLRSCRRWSNGEIRNGGPNGKKRTNRSARLSSQVG